MSRIVTFYSYKGGVGRTFALANVGVLLAQQGKRVLLIDWDLEAPGLHRFFERQLQKQSATTSGLIHLLSNAIKDPTVVWEPFITDIAIDSVTNLSLLTSGDQADDYVDKMRSFSWTTFFEQHGGGEVLDRWRREWKETFDFVLIDSRTGITDTGGICTIFLPDFLVFVFVTNEQSFERGIQIMLGIQDARQHLDVPRPPAMILPVIGRFDGRDEVDEAAQWLDHFDRNLKVFYDDWLPSRFVPRQMLELTKIPYVAKFSFGEPLPVLSHGVTDPELPGYYLDNVARLLLSDFRDAVSILAPVFFNPPAGIVTFMFTDIVSSTVLRDTFVVRFGEHDGNTFYRERLLDPHNKRIRGFIAKHRGFEVAVMGDSFLIAFAQPEDAVRCAADIQRSLRGEPIVAEDVSIPLSVRIGIHTGAARYIERDGSPDYDGLTINIAARVQGLLYHGDRIYCSGETVALSKSVTDVRFHSYGAYTLKGVSGKVEIFDALWDQTMQPLPPRAAYDTLPYPWLTEWVGREREMTFLEEALRTSRLVTIHGTGGVGKTRLAVETLLARGGGLPREIIFVPLEHASDGADGLAVALREALALTEVDAPDLAAICRHLHGGDRLLLLDNFEAVMSAASYVPRLATTPGVRVLVTSQQELGVSGEQVLDLDPMATKGDLVTLESYRLFVGLAQQRDARWQPDDDTAMRDVLAATDGLPYLIELVAAVAPKRKLRQLANELKTRVQEVRARGASADLAGRHASVQACLEWALARLPAEEREALPRLALFAGGFDTEAAEAVASTYVGSLDVLVDASLLRFDRDNGHYSMLATTQQFLRSRLSNEERATLPAEHARWFIERLDHANNALRTKGGEVQGGARRWIDREYENVRHAVAWAEENDSVLFERAVRALGLYLRLRYRFAENVTLNETLLSRVDPETDIETWAEAHSNLGNAYRDLPTGSRGVNLAKAIAHYKAALRIYTERDFPSDWAMTQNNLGIAYLEMPEGDRRENVAKAIACYEAALRVYAEHAFPANWAMTLNNLGAAYADLMTGDRAKHLANAITYYEEALRIRTESDFPADWATTQNNLGIAYLELPEGDRRENLAKAIACFEAALRVQTERDFPADWAMTQNNLGTAYADLSMGDREENLAKAVACYEAALRVRTERDFPKDWADTQYNLGSVYSQLWGGGSDEYVRQAKQCFEAAARGYAAVGLDYYAEQAQQRAAKLATKPS